MWRLCFLPPGACILRRATMNTAPDMTPQQEELSDTSASGLALYRRLAVGGASTPYFIAYEAALLLFSGLPGLLGLGIRSLAYPGLFRSCGRRPAFGRGVVLRVPNQVSLGSGVVVDDYAALDVRGEGASIEIKDRAIIGRFTAVAAKGGTVSLGAGCNIGSHCRIATNSKVEIGESVLLGAYCYVGPGNHQQGEEGQSLISSPMELRGGVSIGDHAWLGTRVTVLDGVKIGRHAIIGAHSLVMEDVPDYGVAVGAPAKVIRINAPH